MDDERSHRTVSVDDAAVAWRVDVDAYENDDVVSHWDTVFDEGTIVVTNKSDLDENIMTHDGTLANNCLTIEVVFNQAE
jgi:hypothetical protein